MSSEFVDTYLTLIEFFYDNREIIVPTDSTSTISVSDIILTDATRELDENIINIAIDTRLRTYNFFNNVIDQQPFKGADYNRLRMYLIDWYSANQVILTTKLSGLDPFSLTDDLIDIAFKSFGYDYSNLIFDQNTRVQFLLSLTELYKKKGSPQALVDVLKFYGFNDITLYEWWLTLKNNETLEFEGRLLDTGSTLTEFPERRSIDYDQFSAVNDPHWSYTKTDILDIQQDYDSQGLIGLPSLTPYFSIAGGSNLRSITQNFAILARMLNDQYTNWLYGGNVPQDIFVDIYGSNVSLLALYAGILYSYHRYNDYVKFISLRDYIYEQFPNVPLDTEFTFSQPYAYEKLLLWAITRTDSDGKPQYLDLQAISYTDDSPIVEYTPTTGGWLRPKDNTPFGFYPTVLENYGFWQSITDSPSDAQFNYDESLILFDQRYGNIGISAEMEEFLKYLFAQDFTDDDSISHTIPEYNVPINTISDLSGKLQPFFDEFEEISSRPQTYDEAKEKQKKFFKNYSQPQRLDYIQNTYDPERVLGGLGRINPGGTYPTASDGDQILITGTSTTDPYVQEYNSGSWATITDGLIKGLLGIDKTFLTWIDTAVGEDPFEYISVTSKLLQELDVFFASYIQRIPISTTQLLSGSKLAEDLIPVINFWKPYRARFTSFELIGTIAEPVPDSAIQKDEVSVDVWERDDINGTHYREQIDGSMALYRKLDQSEWATGTPS